ncbi:MAG: alanine racemase [Bacteroidota bacterium]|nr:alanine racemase [Bacteroidota bacterium]MDP4233047.1 alanine racemase [Bacteroidota bacterium]MDP4241808.1 alanine racemase [Bacteroidota bacterium]MDP4288771.1 alanine racemase [Bacteroidota bacterium]
MRPTRAEIHVEHFLHNLKFVRSRIGPRARIMPIVKANAYGHGLDIIARAALESQEIGYFGVATEEEGARLRRLTSLPILVLTGVLPDETEFFLQHQLDFTLTDRETLHAIAARAQATGARARVHLKVDTGMRRMGVEPEDAIPFLREIVSLEESIELVGLATHFATSDELDQSFFRRQLSAFEAVVREAKDSGIEIPLVHAANSGAILQLPCESAFDMVRPGIMLYGYAPSLELQEQYGGELQPALGLVSTVVFKKHVKAGEGVSYNLRWHAPRDTQIATVPIGYGDGYPRLLTGRAVVMIRDKTYPIVGAICMDQVMIDVGEDDVKTGDLVQFITPSNDGIDAWGLARAIGTVPYEILTGIAARVPRVQIVT